MALFTIVLQLVPLRKVTMVVADFEAAIWVSLRQLMPGVKLKGCLFHFCQAIYRKMVNDLNLKRSYNRDPGTKQLCRKLMALPLLPIGSIRSMFRKLTCDIELQSPLWKLADYMFKTWIEGRLFKPEDWCWYAYNTRTNNDVEGWHNRFNYRNEHKSNIPFYSLVSFLFDEATSIDMTMMQIYTDRNVRRQRAGTQERQKFLQKHWKKMKDGRISCDKFLTLVIKHKCVTPSDNWETDRPRDGEEE